MNKDVNIWVFGYEEPSFKIIEDDIHIPLQVGAYNRKQICRLADDSLDNISEKNPIYSELTGLYWVWKNMGDVKYKGCEHFRRHFNLNQQQIETILGQYEIILPKRCILNAQNCEDFHNEYHNIKDLKLCEEILLELYPEYEESYNKIIKNSNEIYIANSFITSNDNFDKICEFLFTIFFEFEKRMGFSTIDEWRNYVIDSNVQICPPDHKEKGRTWVDYQLRIFGFLSERLITLYALHNFKDKIYETELIRLDKQKEEMKTLLCCIGRRENAYIREYVGYNKALGFTNICLFDNNYDGEEDFRDVIGDYIDNGFVILKDYRNRKVCQLDAYNECYRTYGEEYDWIAFFDIDEFMFVNCNRTIGEYLARPEFKDFDMLHINWLLFGDSGQLRNDGRGILQRLTQHLDINHKTLYDFPDNFHSKSIIRGGLKNVYWDGTSHTPECNLKCCNSYGIPCDGNSPFVAYDFRNAGIRHFTTKTAVEYADKIKKGFPDANPITKEKMVQVFFDRNEVTPEKVAIFKEINGIDMSHLLPKVYEGVKNEEVKIYSLCYEKKKFDFLDDAVITPLQVGAANGTNVCALKDNTGDNVSGGNYFYIENTGTYWIWKNVKSKYKGQMQYRRPLSGVTDEMNFEEVFEKYDVITCEPFHHPSHKVPTADEPMIISADTVEQGYAFSNCLDDLLILEMAIKMYYPEYAEDYDKYIKNGPNLYYSNGFVMKSEDFDRYSEFLFNCLNGYLYLADIKSQKELVEHVKYNIETGKYQRYPNVKNVPPQAIQWQCSIGGFLSERLWTLWLQHNFKDEKVLKLPYIKMEDNMYT